MGQIQDTSLLPPGQGMIHLEDWSLLSETRALNETLCVKSRD